VLLVFKESLGEIVKLVEVMDAIQMRLDIPRIPHFTTLSKFFIADQFNNFYIGLQEVSTLSYRDTGQVSTIAIDSTDFPT
jgi:hypothetical protein